MKSHVKRQRSSILEDLDAPLRAQNEEQALVLVEELILQEGQAETVILLSEKVFYIISASHENKAFKGDLLLFSLLFNMQNLVARLTQIGLNSNHFANQSQMPW